MKAFVGNRNDDLAFEFSDIEFSCTKKELDVLIDLLLQFQEKVNHYIDNNKNATELGFTHMHYRDNNKIWCEDDADIVFYVNCNER